MFPYDTWLRSRISEVPVIGFSAGVANAVFDVSIFVMACWAAANAIDWFINQLEPATIWNGQAISWTDFMRSSESRPIKTAAHLHRADHIQMMGLRLKTAPPDAFGDLCTPSKLATLKMLRHQGPPMESPSQSSKTKLSDHSPLANEHWIRLSRHLREIQEFQQ